jgi:hypothetical protein
MAGTRQNGRGRHSVNWLIAAILALLAFCSAQAFAADKPTTTFRCSIKRPFPFDSDKLIKLPGNPLIDSNFVSFQTSPNSRFFQVFVSFELKGPIDAKRVVVAEIRLLDDHGKTIAADTYQCADMRGSAVER